MVHNRRKLRLASCQFTPGIVLQLFMGMGRSNSRKIKSSYLRCRSHIHMAHLGSVHSSGLNSDHLEVLLRQISPSSLRKWRSDGLGVDNSNGPHRRAGIPFGNSGIQLNPVLRPFRQTSGHTLFGG